jgi:hypothetical protein
MCGTYGKHAKLARRIIQKNDARLVSKLFRFVDVHFEEKFDKAVHMAQTLSSHKNVVVATQFDLVDRETSEKSPHTVSLWFNRKGTGFLYDTMGEITGKESVYMDVYKDYPIVRDVLGLETMRGGSAHEIDSSYKSLFSQLHMMETNWRFLHMPNVSVEDVAMHSMLRTPRDVVQYSRDIMKRAFDDV